MFKYSHDITAPGIALKASALGQAHHREMEPGSVRPAGPRSLGQHLADRLFQIGVKHIFGVPGASRFGGRGDVGEVGEHACRGARRWQGIGLEAVDAIRCCHPIPPLGLQRAAHPRTPPFSPPASCHAGDYNLTVSMCCVDGLDCARWEGLQGACHGCLGGGTGGLLHHNPSASCIRLIHSPHVCAAPG